MRNNLTGTDLKNSFDRYYSYLVNVAFKILGDAAEAEDHVQNVFLKLWSKRKRIKVDGELKSYLTKSVINSCYDHLSGMKMKRSKTFVEKSQNSLDTENQIQFTELQFKLEKALAHLPKQCRLIFSLSRFQGMSSKAIAAHLDLSKKTVDNQIGIALKKLREELSEYLTLHCFPFDISKLLSL